jgi:hypothetical protein
MRSGFGGSRIRHHQGGLHVNLCPVLCVSWEWPKCVGRMWSTGKCCMSTLPQTEARAGGGLCAGSEVENSARVETCLLAASCVFSLCFPICAAPCCLLGACWFVCDDSLPRIHQHINASIHKYIAIPALWALTTPVPWDAPCE